MAKFLFSAFADEASADILEQIAACKANGIEYIELRNVNGKNISNFTVEEAKELKKLLDQGMLKRDALKMISVSFDEINIISSKWMVQRGYRVKGGTLIEFQEKKMDVQEKYLEIYEKNMNN